MKGLEFDIKVPDNLLLQSYKSDQGRIKQVLLNLISNSLKFTERGGSITVEISQITKSYDEYLQFSVIDTGIGIPDEDIPKLFQMFSMLDQHKMKMNQKGTGIGLAISKKIVESLGGDLIVKSEEGKYSEFSFTIFCCLANTSQKSDFLSNQSNDTNEQHYRSSNNSSITEDLIPRCYSDPIMGSLGVFLRKAKPHPPLINPRCKKPSLKVKRVISDSIVNRFG